MSAVIISAISSIGSFVFVCCFLTFLQLYRFFCEAIIFFTHEARPSEKRKIKKVVSALLSFVCEWELDL